jgi:hypothetical protein
MARTQPCTVDPVTHQRVCTDIVPGSLDPVAFVKVQERIDMLNHGLLFSSVRLRKTMMMSPEPAPFGSATVRGSAEPSAARC